jgi:hypothetical protein
MPVKRAVALIALMLVLASCSTQTQVHDVPAHEATWINGRRTVADGSHLKMIFDSDGENLGIERVDFKVYEGELYLWPVRASEMFAPVTFTLDTTTMQLKSPWHEHVYWVESANWNNVVGRIVHPSPLGERVDRVKADVEAAD